MKILYIAGSGRSGSTVIGNILGSQKGISHIGEACWISNNIVNKDLLCGCGSSFRGCTVWDSIIKQAFPKLSNKEVAKRLDFASQNFTCRNVVTALLGVRYSLSDYLDALEKLYNAISNKLNTNVIVDTSKVPSYGFLLSQLKNTQVYFLHLVRDPRAVAYSWSKNVVLRKDTNKKESHQEVRALNSACRTWLLWNVTTELLQYSHNYMRINYEDFALYPVEVLNQVLTYIEEPQSKIPDHHSGVFTVSCNHTVWGNPNRMMQGKIKVQHDQKWIGAMPNGDKVKAYLMTLPLAVRYGYPADI